MVCFVANIWNFMYIDEFCYETIQLHSRTRYRFTLNLIISDMCIQSLTVLMAIFQVNLG